MSRITARPVAVPRVVADTAPTKGAEAAQPAPASQTWAPSATRVVRPAATPAPTEVATRYFEAFSRADAAAMASLYAPNATFQDPIYSLESGPAVGSMWTKLFKAGKDLHLSSKVLSESGDTVKVAWVADYRVFGRPVHNEAVSQLQVREGKIVSQRDDWSWSKWAKQALPLGPLVDFAPVKALLLAVLRSG